MPKSVYGAPMVRKSKPQCGQPSSPLITALPHQDPVHEFCTSNPDTFA